MLPAGIGVTHTCLSVQRGTLDEFKKVIQDYEEKVAELAKTGVDVINPSGAPPFMVLGYDGEQKLIRGWEEKYKIPIFTSGSSHVDALRALGAKRFVGATYFRGDINKTYAKYFVDAGFEVLDMAGMDVDFEKVPELTSQTGLRFRQSRLHGQPHRPTRSTCLVRPGGRPTSSRSWSTTSACRWCTRCRRNAGISRGTSTCASRCQGFGRLAAEMP